MEILSRCNGKYNMDESDENRNFLISVLKSLAAERSRQKLGPHAFNRFIAGPRDGPLPHVD